VIAHPWRRFPQRHFYYAFIPLFGIPSLALAGPNFHARELADTTDEPTKGRVLQ
jgi:hypothetical protein